MPAIARRWTRQDVLAGDTEPRIASKPFVIELPAYFRRVHGESF